MELKSVTQIQFDAIAVSHELWLSSGRKEGLCAELSGTVLRECEFSGKNLTGASFRNSDLSGMMIRDVTLDDCDFTGANLSGTSLEKVSALNSNFSNANLHRLNQCSPGNRQVNMAGALFENAVLTELFLHSINLTGARFSKAGMGAARLIYCQLAGAKFTNCSMKGVDFRFAKLDDVDFSGSDLAESIFMEDLPASIVWGNAILGGMRKIQGGSAPIKRLDHEMDSIYEGKKMSERKAVAS